MKAMISLGGDSEFGHPNPEERSGRADLKSPLLILRIGLPKGL